MLQFLSLHYIIFYVLGKVDSRDTERQVPNGSCERGRSLAESCEAGPLREVHEGEDERGRQRGKERDCRQDAEVDQEASRQEKGEYNARTLNKTSSLVLYIIP